jgi:thioredoxin 1
MPTHEIKSKQFDDLVNNNKIVFIDFWAAWCAPCGQFASVYERVAEQNPALKFAKVNIEEEKELAESLQIRSIPHLMVFKEGILVYSEAGFIPESVLKDLVQQAINVDVSKIRQNLDKSL